MSKRYYLTEEDEMSDGAKAIGIGIMLLIIIFIIYIILAIVIVWCLISSISCYCKSIKTNVKKEYDGTYSLKKGFSDLGNTIIDYWHNIVEYSGESFSKNIMHKIVGVFIYPLGFIFFLIFVLLHSIIMILYSSVLLIFGKKQYV